MRNRYLIKLSDGAILRNRGGLRRTLTRYSRLNEIDDFSLLARLGHATAAFVAVFANMLTPQLWRISLEVSSGGRTFDLTITHDGAGFVADCFVRVFGPDRFGLLYESLNPDTGKGEIAYRLYRAGPSGVELMHARTLLANPERHYSYPAFVEVGPDSFTFTVESIDRKQLEIHRADFHGIVQETACVAGEYIDPCLVAVPGEASWLLLYSDRARPDELVIQLMRRKGIMFVPSGDEFRVLNACVARGGGDVSIEPAGKDTLQLIRHAQLALPVYGSDLARSRLELVRNGDGWRLSGLEIDEAFGAEYRRKRRAKGIHTFSADSAAGLSVIAYDWR